MSWIVPSGANSDHPPASVHRGQAYVTSRGQCGHEESRLEFDGDLPELGRLGRFLRRCHTACGRQERYGLRVPGIVISPYAKHGFIDHQMLSSDAYLKFIEDFSLHGAGLKPGHGRPARSRPDVREDAPELGNLAEDFNFSQLPRAPVLLPTNPPTDSPAIPSYFTGRHACYGCTSPPPGPFKVRSERRRHQHR